MVPPTPPSKPPKPPELEGLDESPSGAHVVIDGKLYLLEEAIVVAKQKGDGDEESEATGPTENKGEPGPEKGQTVAQAVLEFLLTTRVNGLSAASIGLLVSGMGTGTGACAGAATHAKADEARNDQIAALTQAVTDSNAEMADLRAEYVAHKEIHERSAYQVEQLAVKVSELIALENELHPRQR